VIPKGFDLKRLEPYKEAKPRLMSILGLLGGKNMENRKLEMAEHNRDEIDLIGFVARHDPMKDHSTFFRAASAFLRERKMFTSFWPEGVWI
jgi:hypothetical protein